MALPQAIKEGRKFRGIAQGALDIPYSQQMVSAIESGEREVAPDIAPMLAERLDHPAVYLEMGRELSGGVGSPWLNGENVDLHRASVRERCIEELSEALEYIQRTPASKPPSVETDGERRKRQEHLMQAIDAKVALDAYVGVQCLEYGYSMQRLYQEHYKKLKGLRYVQA